jgi:hypothetical protein
MDPRKEPYLLHRPLVRAVGHKALPQPQSHLPIFSVSLTCIMTNP